MRSDRGVSTTEYVLLLVMIGILSMLAVKSFGVQIKRLWSESGNQLSTVESGFEEEGEDPGLPRLAWEPPPTVGDGDMPDPDENSSPPDDCGERFAAMDQEYDQQTGALSAAIDDAQARYDALMETRSVYHRGGRWGGFGHWSQEYIHPQEERDAAAQQLADARSTYDDFQADWQDRYEQLQSECGD